MKLVVNELTFLNYYEVLNSLVALVLEHASELYVDMILQPNQ